MRINLKAVIALIFAVVIIVAGFNALQVQTYSGSELTFTMSGGPVTIVNPSDAPGTALLTTAGTSGTFAVRGTGITGTQTSTREGSVRTAVNSITVPLESGETTLQIMRGSNVQATLTGSNTFTVTAAPMNENSSRDTVVFVAVVAVAAVAYALWQVRDTLRSRFGSAERRTRIEAEMSASTYNQ